jgi:pilus assembly protein Flp/PilA
MGEKGMTGFDTFTSTAGRQLKRFCADESGATAIEYAMIAVGIAAAIAGTVYNLGSAVNAKLYGNLGSALN